MKCAENTSTSASTPVSTIAPTLGSSTVEQIVDSSITTSAEPATVSTTTVSSRSNRLLAGV